ncbi:MAG: signal peptidase I [Actinomycetota bacterium]
MGETPAALSARPAPGSIILDNLRSRMPSRRITILIAAVVVLLGFFLLLRAFVFSMHTLPAATMTPSLQAGDRVLINKLDTSPALGDVVMFGRGEETATVQRVVGLAGQTIEASDNTLVIDGLVAVEPYLAPDTAIADFDPIEVPEGSVLLMGDNREVAIDGRVLGPIPTSEIVGTVLFTVG